MSVIYLIRHAQAGSRDNYDVLSELGRQQARSLGECFARQGIELSVIYSGSMRRQRHTAEIVSEAMLRAGCDVPDIVVDPRWDEFSLATVYRAIAGLIRAENEEFARDFEQMQEALRSDPHTTRGATGRCDLAVVRAWMENRYPDYEGETWSAFNARIRNCAGDLFDHGGEKGVAVFTSATPIAILTGAALALSDEKLLSVLGVLYNSSVTTMHAREGAMRLFSFNATPHLDSHLMTFR